MMTSLDKPDLSTQEICNTIIDSSEVKNPIPWPDPTPEELNSLWFNQIWNVIKTWDINGEPTQPYHVIYILNAIKPNKIDEIE